MTVHNSQARVLGQGKLINLFKNFGCALFKKFGCAFAHISCMSLGVYHLNSESPTKMILLTFRALQGVHS